MSLHHWLGRHVADHRISRWDRGHFVSNCKLCDREMIRLPGMPWRLRETQSA